MDSNNKIQCFSNPYYLKLIENTEKLILLIRDASNVIEKKIFKALPENIKQKTLIYLLENLSD
jgi:hypothetical protein